MEVAIMKAMIIVISAAAIISSIWRLSTGHSDGDVQEVVYRAAVLEMRPFDNPEITPLENMLENVRVIHEHSAQAKEQGADIIVFPEVAIYSGAPRDRTEFLPYGQYVPDANAKECPCEWDTPFNRDEIVRKMSCHAKELQMYMVFNMPERVDCDPDLDPKCPEDGHYFYNLNVVLDRQGRVIGKWRKLHLFREPHLDVGNTPDEEAMFTTDFGVTFTQHTCFDVLFYRPTLSNIEKYGVKDVIMPTSWVDYFPLVTAPQAQYGYSRGNNINLLVAGRHRPRMSAIGSGIYTGAFDINNSINVYNDTQGTKLLVRDVRTTASHKNLLQQSHPKPSLASSGSSSLEHKAKGMLSLAKVTGNHYFFEEDLSGFFHKRIAPDSSGSVSGVFTPPGHANESIEYNLQWELEGDGEYFLMLNSGATGLAGFELYRQVTALLYCAEGLESCGKVSLKRPTKATFHHLNITLRFDTPHLYPSVIDQDFALVGEDRWGYNVARRGSKKHEATIYLKRPLDFLFAATVSGRWFGRDPFCQSKIC